MRLVRDETGRKWRRDRRAAGKSRQGEQRKVQGKKEKEGERGEGREGGERNLKGEGREGVRESKRKKREMERV